MEADHNAYTQIKLSTRQDRFHHLFQCVACAANRLVVMTVPPPGELEGALSFPYQLAHTYTLGHHVCAENMHAAEQGATILEHVHGKGRTVLFVTENKRERSLADLAFS